MYILVTTIEIESLQCIKGKIDNYYVWGMSFMVDKWAADGAPNSVSV